MVETHLSGNFFRLNGALSGVHDQGAKFLRASMRLESYLQAGMVITKASGSLMLHVGHQLDFTAGKFAAGGNRLLVGAVAHHADRFVV